MPKYFFHSEDGHIFHDAEGTELADVAAARAEATRFAAALLTDRPQELWESTSWRLIVVDEQKAILFTIELKTSIGSAVIVR